MLDGAFDPPAWYWPFTNLQAVAEELHCSVPDVLSDDPKMVELRQYALLKLLAQAQVERDKKPGATA